MIITVTDTPATLGSLIRAAGYVIEPGYDAGVSVEIWNASFDCTTGQVSDNEVLLVEGANLKKKTGTLTNGVPDLFEDGWDAEQPARYIRDAEAYPVLSKATYPFVTRDLDSVFLKVCPGISQTVYVVMNA